MFDPLKSEALRRGANLFLTDRFGELLSLKLDSRSRSMSLEVLLKGETERVMIEVGAVEVAGQPDAPHLILRQIRVSRPWLHELAQSFGEGKPIRIPHQVANLLKVMLL